jgi:hypothetical protein
MPLKPLFSQSTFVNLDSGATGKRPELVSRCYLNFLISIELLLPTVCGWRDVLDCALLSTVLHRLTSSTVLFHAMTGEVEYLMCGTSFRTTRQFRYVTPQRRGLPVSGISSSSAPRVLKSASSTGRCNTIQYIDSTILPREKQSVWLYSVKT